VVAVALAEAPARDPGDPRALSAIFDYGDWVRDGWRGWRGVMRYLVACAR
jgi:hypothetical protein